MKLDVLIVDDCADLRETVGAILQYHGLQVAHAENGRAALALLDAGLDPQMIILDLMMPVMDGWAFLDACREQPHRLQRVVVASSLAGPGELARLRNEYGCRTMDKPFEIEPLFRIAHAMCGGRFQERKAATSARTAESRPSLRACGG